jgi:hypothetical protein
VQKCSILALTEQPFLCAPIFDLSVYSVVKQVFFRRKPLTSCFPWYNSEAKLPEVIVKRKCMADMELLHQSKTGAVSEGIFFIGVTLKVAPSLIPNGLVHREDPGDAGVKQAFTEDHSLGMTDLFADSSD